MNNASELSSSLIVDKTSLMKVMKIFLSMWLVLSLVLISEAEAKENLSSSESLSSKSSPVLVSSVGLYLAVFLSAFCLRPSGSETYKLACDSLTD